jgi:hypothetical protein
MVSGQEQAINTIGYRAVLPAVKSKMTPLLVEKTNV